MLVLGFLFGKMGFVIFTNANELEMGKQRGGLELMCSSKCLMRSTVMVKGKFCQYFSYFFGCQGDFLQISLFGNCLQTGGESCS